MITLSTREYIHYTAEGENYRSPEKVLKIRMPWRKMMYSIANDDERLYHPTFMVHWHRPFPTCVKLRWGWGLSD